MRLIRLYTDEPLNEGSSVLIKNESFHYLAKVLKAKKNQKVTLFNNDGYDYQGFIKNIADKIIKKYAEPKKNFVFVDFKIIYFNFIY